MLGLAGMQATVFGLAFPKNRLIVLTAIAPEVTLEIMTKHIITSIYKLYIRYIIYMHRPVEVIRFDYVSVCDRDH